VGRASTVGEGFGIPNRSPDPLVGRAGRDHPFPISAGSPWRERDVARRVGHGGPAIPGGKIRVSNPTRPRFPLRRSACGASVPPHPLRVASSQSRGLASSSSCRRRRRVVSSRSSACGATDGFLAGAIWYQIAPAKSPSVPAYNLAAGQMMSFICSCRNKKEEPSSIYTLRKVCTIRGCLEGLTLMI
jgi:hypothetical protein